MSNVKVRINEKLKVNKGTIGGDFEILRTEMCFSYGYIAELLDIPAKSLEDLKKTNDRDVDLNLLFRIFFFAQSVIDDKTEDNEFVIRMAKNLKKSCQKEQTKRIRIY